MCDSLQGLIGALDKIDFRFRAPQSASKLRSCPIVSAAVGQLSSSYQFVARVQILMRKNEKVRTVRVFSNNIFNRPIVGRDTDKIIKQVLLTPKHKHLVELSNQLKFLSTKWYWKNIWLVKLKLGHKEQPLH